MQTHFTVLSAIYIGFAAIELFIAAIAAIAIAGGGLLSGDLHAIGITWIVGLSVGGFLVILALPSLIAGLGLYYRKPWSRIMLIILGFLKLFAIPFGTIVGIYTLWVMLKQEAQEELDRAQGYQPDTMYAPPPYGQ